jgi:hypothetical protein
VPSSSPSCAVFPQPFPSLSFPFLPFPKPFPFPSLLFPSLPLPSPTLPCHALIFPLPSSSLILKKKPHILLGTSITVVTLPNNLVSRLRLRQWIVRMQRQLEIDRSEYLTIKDTILSSSSSTLVSPSRSSLPLPPGSPFLDGGASREVMSAFERIREETNTLRSVHDSQWPPAEDLPCESIESINPKKKEKKSPVETGFSCLNRFIRTS